MTRLSSERLDEIFYSALENEDEQTIELIDEIIRLRKDNGELSRKFQKKVISCALMQQQMEASIRCLKSRLSTEVSQNDEV